MQGLLFTYLPFFIILPSAIFPQFPEVACGSVSVCPTVAVAAQLVLPRGHATTLSPGKTRPGWPPTMTTGTTVWSMDYCVWRHHHFRKSTFPLPSRCKSNVQSFAGRYGPAPLPSPSHPVTSGCFKGASTVELVILLVYLVIYDHTWFKFKHVVT